MVISTKYVTDILDCFLVLDKITGNFSSQLVDHLKGRDTPSRFQLTSGDKSRGCCRLASAALGQKVALKHTEGLQPTGN